MGNDEEDLKSSVVCKCPKCTVQYPDGKLLSKRSADLHRREAVLTRIRESDAAEGSSADDDLRNEPLFPGSRVSLLQAVTLLVSVQGLFPGVSQRAMSEVFRMLHHFILPVENILPNSFNAAKRLITEFLVPVTRYDVCAKDHIVFDGEHADSLCCPECNESRYMDNTTKKAKKVFWYIPLIPRIKRWYKMPAIAKSLQRHESVLQQDILSDIHMSPAWKDMYAEEGVFRGDARCLTFALSADGFDPFNHHKVQYSMCPVLLKCLNFSNITRDKIGRLLLSSIIPGPSGPTDMNPYMAPLVDELAKLEEGVPCFDASKGVNFTLKGRVIMGVFDNPGSSKILKNAAPGSLINACRHCHIEGQYNKDYGKVMYLENRRYLPHDSPLRKDHLGRREKRPPHPLKSTAEQVDIGRQIASMHKRAVEDPSPRERKRAKTAKNRMEKKTGKKGVEELARLPYYPEVDVPVELMHTVQVVMKKFFGLLTGRDDTEKMHDAEAKLQRPVTIGPRECSPWTLTQGEKEAADRRILQIRVPKAVDWTPKKLFTKSTLPYMKCSDWKKLASHGIIKYALQDALDERQRTTLFRLCDIIRQLTDYQVDLGSLDTMEVELHEVLSLIERDFPIGLQTLCMHIMHHATGTLKKYGPATSQWMYGFERFMAFLGGRILNRRQPEATAIEAYRLYEFSQYMAMAGYLPEGSVCTSNSLAVLAAYDGDDACQGQETPLRETEASQEDRAMLQAGGYEVSAVTKFLFAQQEFPSWQKYSCLETDQKKTVVSSIVSGLFQTGGTSANKVGNQYLFFGRVLYFLLCKTSTGELKIAKEAPIRAKVSGLWKVKNPRRNNFEGLVPLSELSPALTSAVDDHGAMWILDYKG